MCRQRKLVVACDLAVARFLLFASHLQFVREFQFAGPRASLFVTARTDAIDCFLLQLAGGPLVETDHVNPDALKLRGCKLRNGTPRIMNTRPCYLPATSTCGVQWSAVVMARSGAFPHVCVVCERGGGAQIRL